MPTAAPAFIFKNKVDTAFCLLIVCGKSMQYNKVSNIIVAFLSNEVHWKIKLFAFILQLKSPIKVWLKKKKKTC